ncbi:MAG: hypothetical protein DLM53_06005 [Candidatus Eremiobacter antarcticus]|nr:TonB-dependent receptor [Candidatus Eremiobacteraeota bacterium]PZR62371.1 MAG: hypothetical protein DLM53_06005 [Candidatus Eremiobacter sp. RRmetagenome_bin22]
MNGLWAVFAAFASVLGPSDFAFAAPEPPATFVAHVTDEHGNPIAGAQIVLTPTVISLAGRATQVFTVRCDHDGECVSNTIPPATYFITVRTGAGVKTVRAPIALTSRNESRITVRIEGGRGSLRTLGTIRVASPGLLSTGSAPSALIDAQQVAAVGGLSLTDSLAQQAGVTVARPHGGAAGSPVALMLRGNDPREAIVDIDGHPVNNSNTGDFDLSLLDPSAFATVQIVYGLAPASLLGGNTEGGTVNFHTLEPTAAPHGFLRLSTGNFRSDGLAFASTGSSGSMGYALQFHRFNETGEIADYRVIDSQTGQSASLNSWLNGSSTLAKLRYAIGRDGYAELSTLSLSTTRDLSAALSAPVDPSHAGQGSVFTSFAGSVRFNTNGFYDADVHLPLGPQAADGTRPASVTVRHQSSSARQGVSGPADDLSEYLLDGADAVEDDSVTYDRLQPNSDFTLMMHVRAERLSLPDEFGDDSPLQAQTERSITVRYIWRGRARLEYTASGVFSSFDTFGKSFDPRFAAVWTPSDGTVVRASLGTGFQAPLLTDRFVPSPLPPPDDEGLIHVGNPNLTADRTTEYEIDAEHRFGEDEARSAQAAVDFYRVNVRGDEIVFVPPGVSPTSPKLSFPVNLSSSVWQGAVLRVEQPLTASTTARVSYDINQAYPLTSPSALFSSDEGVLVGGQQFEGVPMHRATLSFEHRANVSWLIGLAYEGLNNDLHRPAFATVQANLTYRRGHTDMTIAGSNLTNVYDDKFTLLRAGVPYPGPSELVPPNAYSLQGRTVNLTIAQRW